MLQHLPPQHREVHLGTAIPNVIPAPPTSPRATVSIRSTTVFLVSYILIAYNLSPTNTEKIALSR